MQKIVENDTHKSGNSHEKGTLKNGTTPYHRQVKLPPPPGLVHQFLTARPSYEMPAGQFETPSQQLLSPAVARKRPSLHQTSDAQPPAKQRAILTEDQPDPQHDDTVSVHAFDTESLDGDIQNDPFGSPLFWTTLKADLEVDDKCTDNIDTNLVEILDSRWGKVLPAEKLKAILGKYHKPASCKTCIHRKLTPKFGPIYVGTRSKGTFVFSICKKRLTTPLIDGFAISEEKILNIIRALNINKAHGWDEISVRMIKLSDAALILPLKIIFTNCLRHGLFPEIWKHANVVPVHKKNEKNLKGNYRPISLLPIFGKILEKLVYDSLYTHLVSCELLNPNQSGFRPGDSTINQLISITHTIFKAFDCNPPLDVRSVYLDLSKAFDRVWHDGLIYKLKRCGVSGQLLSLVENFLKNRKQRTVLNGQCSGWGDISAGVPQGSILGPLFFLVYINDLTMDLKCNVKLFADDTSLFTIVQDPNTAASDMNHDLELIKSGPMIGGCHLILMRESKLSK